MISALHDLSRALERANLDPTQYEIVIVPKTFEADTRLKYQMLVEANQMSRTTNDARVPISSGTAGGLAFRIDATK